MAKNRLLKSPFFGVIQNQIGSAAFLTVVGIAAAMALTFASIGFPKGENQILAVGNNQMTGEILQANILNIVTQKQAWSYIVNDPENSATFSCILNHQPCSPTFRPISVLRDAANEIYFDLRTSSASSFGNDGQVCTGDSPECSIRLVSLEWAPSCSTPCHPQRFKLRFQFARTPISLSSLRQVSLREFNEETSFKPGEAP